MGLREGNEFTADIRVMCFSLVSFAIAFLVTVILQTSTTSLVLALALSVFQVVACAAINLLFGRLGFFIAVLASSIETMLFVFGYLKNNRSIDQVIAAFSLCAILICIIIQIFMSTVYSRMFRVKSLYNQARSRIFKLTEENNDISQQQRNSIIVKHEDRPVTQNKIASADPLTTLPNRYKVINLLDIWIDDRISMMQPSSGRNKDADTGISIIYFKIRNFSTLLNNYGHHTIDLYIQCIAHRLRESLYPHDLLGRISNGEFVVVAKRSMEDKELRDYCDLLTAVVNKSFSYGGRAVEVHTAIGVSKFPENGRYSNDILSCAEYALWTGIRNSEDGTDTFAVYSDILSEKNHGQTVYSPHIKGEKLAKMEEAFPHALENGEIYIVYQPQFDSDLNIHGFEAFLRWNSKELGIVNALEFLQVAERLGLIYDLGAYCLEQAIETLAILNRSDSSLKMTINISATELKNGKVPGTLADMIAKYNIEPKNLIIDIPEECLTSSFDEVGSTIDYIASLGVTMTLDNFGRSYSSLNNIPLLPISGIKLDSIFTRKLYRDDAQWILTASIIDLMHEIDINVCATGVGTQDTFDAMRDFGCDYFQGAFLHSPMRREELKSFLKRPLVPGQASRQEAP